MKMLWCAVAAALATRAAAAVPPAELAALSDLYFGTGGSASWSETEGWDTLDGGATTDPCGGEWYGVTCDEAGKHVVKLELNDNGLDGSLPESIEDLTRVTVLDLQGQSNKLIDLMPSAICEMAALEQLLFRYVQGDGTILPCVGRLGNLTKMDYTYTSFTGTIPLEVCDLTKLEYFQFQFTGGLTGAWGSLRCYNEHA